MKTTTPTAADIQAELRLLYVRRAIAEYQDLAPDPNYIADLLDDIRHQESALAGAAVTELATLRAELNGTLRG